MDLALLWLWCRPAVAALIQHLAWELPYAMGAAPKSKKKKKKKKKNTVLTLKILNYGVQPIHYFVHSGEISMNLVER